MAQFMFATGIENSYPMIALPDGSTKRMDEMEKTDHYRRWREDFGLVNELGIEYLRYGPPYYKTHVGPDRFDWGFADETFHELKRLGITPVADLCHFGVPDWLGNFQNPDFAAYFPEYARAFAERYPWVHYFTPINEMYVTALFSAQLGWWNERLAGDRPFVTALKHIAKANVLAMEAILQVRGGDVMFVQSESAEYFHAAEPAAEDLADHLNEKRFLSLDLNYGFNLCATMVKFLMANGMTWDEFCFFLEQKTKRYCIMGNDYYVTNEHMVYPDGRVQPSGEVFGYYVITKQYFDRYKLPVMHTETNIAEDYAYPRSAPKPQVTPESGSVHWLKKEWANMLRLKRDGVPIIGFTWYSLIDQVDWDTALREDNGHVNPLGLYDIDRKIRPVGEAYRHLIAQWRDILPTQSICLQVA